VTEHHTYLMQPGRWEILGSTVDVAGNPNAMLGYAVVTHGESWEVHEQLNENPSRYDVRPPAIGMPATTFTGTHAILGNVQGAYAFFEDVILSSYRSDDGDYSASEVFRRIADDRYVVHGALFLHGGHVSSWSLTMQRT
jgi:hypothetical protein